MTQTMTAKQIPAEGLTHTAGDVVITAIPTAQAGYRIQVRIDGVFSAELSSGHVFETHALTAWKALVTQYPTAPEPTPAAPTVKLAPAAKGTQTRVSDPGHTVLALAATAVDGIVHRGGKPGQATDRQLRALIRRGYLSAVYQARSDARKVLTGGQITAVGLTRLAELTAADRHAASVAAAVAGVSIAA